MSDRSYRFTHAITRLPAVSATKGLRAVDTGAPDITLMRTHHAAYVAALKAEGATVIELPPLEAFPDAQFVEDVALCLQEGAVITRPVGAGELAFLVAAVLQIPVGHLEHVAQQFVILAQVLHAQGFELKAFAPFSAGHTSPLIAKWYGRMP